MNIDLMSISGHKLYGPKGSVYSRSGNSFKFQCVTSFDLQVLEHFMLGVGRGSELKLYRVAEVKKEA